MSKYQIPYKLTEKPVLKSVKFQKKFTNVYEKCDLKFWKNLGYSYTFEILFIWNQHYQKVFLKTLETLSWKAWGSKF